MARKIMLAAGVLLLLAQFVPVERDNPPVRGDFDGPAAVREILVRSCYDCHSNETHWPWYSKIAPMSWLVTHDVAEGREELNFSEWRTYDARKRTELAVEMLEMVEKREMPMPVYILLHGEAKLAGTEIGTLRGWRP